MGIFGERLRVSNPENGRFKELEMILDSGTSYTQIPYPVLEELGVERKTKRHLKIATGEVITRDAGVALVTLKGETLPTLVIFGDRGSEPLLGTVTLEELGLAIDPVNKTLIPLPGLML